MGRLRTALLRLALVGLLAAAGCQALHGDANAASQVGEFSGRYQDGLPVYLFPTIYVFGTRAGEVLP